MIVLLLLKNSGREKTFDLYSSQPNAGEIVKDIANSFTTDFGYRVKSEEDIQKAFDQRLYFSEILSAVIIYGDMIGISGKFEMKYYMSNDRLRG